ncbi:MAG: hypothetical protein K8J09_06260 [Planctomycetes bacterium]|nr:hypothetical protein [Planctomycetota bacterium]
MSTNRTKRLHEVAGTLRSVPISKAALRRALDTFQRTGELPDDLRLARAVVTRIQTGRDPITDLRQVDWAALFRDAENKAAQPSDPMQDALFEEAVWGPEQVRWAAREVFRTLARAGLDPSQAKWDGMKPPTYGSAGFELLEFPRRIVRPPYRRQAARLFRRIDRLRKRLPHRNRAWFAAFFRAIDDFQYYGERPEDDLMLDAILALGELSMLVRHAVGEDVSQWMAAFDAAARKTGAARDQAIAELQELVVAEQNAID